MQNLQVNIGFWASEQYTSDIIQALEGASLKGIMNSKKWDPQAPFILIIDPMNPSQKQFPIPDLTIALSKDFKRPIGCHDLIYWDGSVTQLSQDIRTWDYRFTENRSHNLNMLGHSPAIKKVIDEIKRVSPFSAVALINGETGTGKELAARGIHYQSQRKMGPFIPVNSGAYSDELFVSEMFGFEKGAFTDAKQALPGLVKQAHGGSLFLDEIDSLSPKAQAALLRFLQNNEYRALGSKVIQHADVRLIAATNKPMEQLLTDGNFREDLYYRLDVLSIEMPPLRHRKCDIPVLAQYFLNQISHNYQQPMKYLTKRTLEWMVEYGWPGNIRELENYLHKAYVHSENSEIDAPDIKQPPNFSAIDTPESPEIAKTDTVEYEQLERFQVTKKKVINNFEKNYLYRALKISNGNISKAARLAGKDRSSFRRLVCKYGIDKYRGTSFQKHKTPLPNVTIYGTD